MLSFFSKTGEGSFGGVCNPAFLTKEERWSNLGRLFNIFFFFWVKSKRARAWWREERSTENRNGNKLETEEDSWKSLGLATWAQLGAHLKGGTPRGIGCELSVRFLGQLKSKNNRQLWKGGVWLDIIDPPPSVGTSQKGYVQGRETDGGGNNSLE